MRLGIMLRHFDQHDGGVKVYTRELLKAMIALNTRHEMVLLFRNRQLGTYAEGTHAALVHEVLLEGGPILAWDQLKVPDAVRRYGIDVLFNPKYSIPLRARCKTAWVCHGLDWYVMPKMSRWIDRLSHRFLVPQYAAKADAVIAVSETTRQHLMQYLNVPGERAHTVISGLSDAFRTTPTEQQLELTRERYRLPPRFLLYCGAVYPPKNFRRLIQAYARVGPAQGVPLVIAGGSNRFLSEDELYEPERLKIGKWVRWLGWLDNAQLPALYRLADGLLLPSLYESVGMPIMEAMASQCPVLTSNRYGTRELAEGAAILVEPESVDDIAAGIDRLLNDQPLRARLIAAGLERSRAFTWERTAAGVLQVLESL
jgi:glycosyltransferase involved in cell wall biosynthesis